jgi:hypothetical protein
MTLDKHDTELFMAAARLVAEVVLLPFQVMECKGRCSAKLMRSGEIGVKLRASDGAALGEGQTRAEGGRT